MKLSKDKRDAIEEAERLSELYKEIKPEKFVLSGQHLFQSPRKNDNLNGYSKRKIV